MKTFIAGIILALGVTAAQASPGAIELTKDYAFSVLRVGYMDHYHHDEKGNDFNLSFAGIALHRQVQMDPFFNFENGLREFGFVFPVKVNSRFYLMPMVFHNFDAGEYGGGIQTTIILRK